MAVKKEQKRFRDVVDRFSPYGVKYDAADIPAIAYHYTDAAGLVGMLRTRKVRATEFRFAERPVRSAAYVKPGSAIC